MEQLSASAPYWRTSMNRLRHVTGDSWTGLAHPLVPLILIILFMATGCAINPYPTDSRPSHRDSDMDSRAEAGTIAYAHRYADRTYEEYRRKLSAEFERQQLLSNSLISIGAATLGVAAFRGSRDAIVATALAGGTGYALGTWDTSKPRSYIYVEGMQALSCAKSAIRPLTFSEGRESELENLKNLRKQLQSSIVQVASAVSKVSGYLAVVQTDPKDQNTELVRTAEQELVDVQPLLSRATEAYVKSQSLTAAVGGAGESLEVTVDRIRAEVTGAIEGTRADLASLPKLISNLSNYADVFAPGVDLAAILSGRLTPSDQEDDSIDRVDEATGKTQSSRERRDGEPKETDKMTDPRFLLAKAIGELRGAVVLLGTYSAQLIGWVDQVKSDQVEATLDGCGIDAKALGRSLSLSRSVVILPPNETRRANISIKGGTLPYSHALETEPAPGINVSTRGDTISVFATEQTVPGKAYRVEVRDAAGATATLTIRIHEKEDAKDEGEDPREAPADGTNGAANPQVLQRPHGLIGQDEVRLLATHRAQRIRVQRSLCTPEQPPAYDPKDRLDGEFGTRTRFRIREFLLATNEETRAKKEPPELSSANIETLSQENTEECGANIMNFYEKALTDKEICQLRVKLELGAEPRVLDDNVRIGIFSLADAVDTKARDLRQLNKALFDQISALPPDTQVCG